MIKLFLIGDSIVTAYGRDEENIIGGWGDHLGYYFDEKSVKVISCACGGKSTRSYLNDGRFIDNGNFNKNMFPYGVGPCYDLIDSGDYVFIEFCHNDDDSARSEKRALRHTPLGEPDKYGIYPTVTPNGDMPYSFECGATYKGFLKYYIDKIREKNAVPILVTPPPRGSFVNGKIASVPGNHGGTDKFGEYAYVRAMRQVGEEEEVTVVDLFEKAKNFIDGIGEEKFKYLQSIKDFDGKTIGEARFGRPKKWPDDYDTIMESGEYASTDNTHQNRYGSCIYAGFIAGEVKEKVSGLSDCVLNKPIRHAKVPAGLKYN